MKKLILSGALIAAFIVYGLHQRQESDSVAVVAPASLVATDTPVPTETPTPAPVEPGTAPSPTPAATATPTPTPSGRYKDGAYTGSAADAVYGYVQVKAVISGGKITDVVFLRYPNDRSTSISINTQAMPYLKQEAIQAQSAQVDGVSGASDTSAAFIESLGNALSQAS